jgi:hypothetical protein
VNYDASGPVIRVIIGPVRFTVFPRKKKVNKKKKAAKTTAPPKEKTPASKPSAKPIVTDPPPKPVAQKGGSWTDFLPLVRVALNFLGDFRRKLRVNMLQLHLVMAGDDPCDLAVNYGRLWAAVSGLISQLERFFIIKKRSVNIGCDFTADQTLVEARLDLTITLGRLLSLIVVYGFRGIKEYLRIHNKRKGGATK